MVLTRRKEIGLPKKKKKELTAADFALETDDFYGNAIFEPVSMAGFDWSWFLQTLKKPPAIEPQLRSIFPFYTSPFGALLLDPPWGAVGYETPEKVLQYIPVNQLMPSGGVIFLWLPRYHVPTALAYMHSLGFEYAEYITFVRSSGSPLPESRIPGNFLSHSNTCHQRAHVTHSVIRFPFGQAEATVRLVEKSSTLFIFKRKIKSKSLNLQKGIDVMYDSVRETDGREQSQSCFTRSVVSRQFPCCRYTAAGSTENVSSGAQIFGEVYRSVETIIPVGRFLEVWGTKNNNRSRWISIIPQQL
mmetsp:Transcript_20496/g.32010  ORF Transcript_20496/g.32010 Transcript_20496/m.32010 type:complete len:302 (-) Transcript_20496:16-921(-)